MEKSLTIIGYSGYFFAIIGCAIAIVLLATVKIKNDSAWSISGISLLIGMFLVFGDRIISITTPFGKMALEAEGKMEEIKKTSSQIDQLKIDVKYQIKDIEEELKSRSDVIFKNLEPKINISIIQREIDRNKRLIKDLKDTESDNRYKSSLEEGIALKQKELDDLQKQLK